MHSSSTRVVKNIFESISNGGTKNIPFASMLEQRYSNNLELSYNSVDITMIIRLFKQYIREGIKRDLDNNDVFIGVKSFVRIYKIDLSDEENCEHLETLIIDASDKLAELLTTDIRKILQSDVGILNPTVVYESKVINKKELNRILIEVVRYFSQRLYLLFAEQIKLVNNVKCEILEKQEVV